MQSLQKEFVFAGVWHNQHNSQLSIDIGKDGTVGGSFMTGVGAGSENSETFPLIGFATEDMISFSVNFAKYGCLTSWVGQLSNDKELQITATWIMMADTHHQPDKLWRAVWTGQDVFSVGPRIASAIPVCNSIPSHPFWDGTI